MMGIRKNFWIFFIVTNLLLISLSAFSASEGTMKKRLYNLELQCRSSKGYTVKSEETKVTDDGRRCVQVVCIAESQKDKSEFKDKTAQELLTSSTFSEVESDEGFQLRTWRNVCEDKSFDTVVDEKLDEASKKAKEDSEKIEEYRKQVQREREEKERAEAQARAQAEANGGYDANGDVRVNIPSGGGAISIESGVSYGGTGGFDGDFGGYTLTFDSKEAHKRYKNKCCKGRLGLNGLLGRNCKKVNPACLKILREKLGSNVSVGVKGSVSTGSGRDKDKGRDKKKRRRSGGGFDVSASLDADLGDFDSGSYRGRSHIWRANGGKYYRCAVNEDIETCLNERYGEILISRHDAEICFDCSVSSSSRYHSNNGWGTQWGAFLGGTAEVLASVAPAYFGYKSNKAMYGAMETGFEQCKMMQTHYVDATYQHISSNELPDRNVRPPGCNGYNMYGFAGTGGYYNNGFGSFSNPHLAAGFSNPFMAYSNGPSGNYNPYFNASAGWNNPHAGLYNNGMNGHLNLNLNNLLGIPNGINLNGSFNPHMNGSFNPGVNGSFNPGFNSNIQCFRAPCPNGNGSFNPYITGNFNSQYQHGYNTLNPWNNSQGSYHHNTSANGGDFWAVQQSHASNQYAQGAGNYYQQQALQNQFSRAGNNLYNHQYNSSMNYNSGFNSGYNYNAAFSPFNVNASFRSSFGF